MSWEGRSCNGKNLEGSSVGVVFYGENGSLLIPAGNSYTLFDLDGNIVKEVKNTQEIDARDKSNPAEKLDALHIQKMALVYILMWLRAIKVRYSYNWEILPNGWAVLWKSIKKTDISKTMKMLKNFGADPMKKDGK